jgi:hypothetical protein
VTVSIQPSQVGSSLAGAGTFLFPPAHYGPAGIDSYIQFWENAAISDRVLSNVKSAYRHNRERWLGDQLDRWAVTFGNDPGNIHRWSKKAVTREDIASEHEAARTIELARLSAKRSIEYVYNSQARALACAAQMYNNCGSFTPGEQAQVDSHKLVIARGLAAETVKSLYERYHLKEIVGAAFVDHDLAVQYELEELRRHIGARDIL